MNTAIYIALAYVLMYYYGNAASNIRRDLTKRLSFITIGEPKCSEILSYIEDPNFQKFLGACTQTP